MPRPAGADPAPIRARAGATARVDREVWFVYCLVFIASGLEAYTIGSIPIQYVGAVGVALFVPLFVSGKYGSRPGQPLRWFLPFILWAVVITAIGSTLDDYSDKMPFGSTTSYGVYMFVRFLNLAAFAATIYLVGSVIHCRGLTPVIARTVELALLFALAGLYLYYAPLVGLPEPPRGRNGTQGGAQSVLSTYYDFHRALGTFREPGIFAQWLAPLFCLSFLHSGVRRVICLGVMSTVLLLTGSLTGFFGIVGGIIVAAIIVYRGRASMLKVVLATCASLAIASVLFTFLVRNDSASTGQTGNLSATLTRRITPMLNQGVSGTDRAYIYNYVASAPAPVFGVGIGNSALDLAEATSSPIPGAFLSLYLDAYYSLGPIGLILLCVFLLAPIVRAALCPFADRKQLFWFLAAYCCVLVAYTANGDELSTIPALTFALLWFGVDAVQRTRRSQAAAVRALPKHTIAPAPYPAAVGIAVANPASSSRYGRQITSVKTRKS